MIQELLDWVSKFRVLEGWKVEFDDNAPYKGQCTINEETKRATVYGWGNLRPCPPDYLFHEVLHIAFKAAKKAGREGEELFVQDLCCLFFPKETHESH